MHGAEPEDRIALLQAALADALVVARAPSPAVRRALALMDRDDGKLRIASLAEAVGVGARQLERLFVDEVGIAPKQLASVLRFRGALEGMIGGAELAALAQRCGYVDQSHLVRDFTRFAGTAPTRFVATELRRARREWLTRPRAAS